MQPPEPIAAHTTPRKRWPTLSERFQEAAQRASASAARCLEDVDFDSAAYYRGRASAFRDAEVLAGKERRG